MLWPHAVGRGSLRKAGPALAACSVCPTTWAHYHWSLVCSLFTARHQFLPLLHGMGVQTVHSTAQDVRELLDALKLESVVLQGASGGWCQPHCGASMAWLVGGCQLIGGGGARWGCGRTGSKWRLPCVMMLAQGPGPTTATVCPTRTGCLAYLHQSDMHSKGMPTPEVPACGPSRGPSL